MTDETDRPEDNARHGFATRAVHAGRAPDPATGAITTPIHTATTYVQESPGSHKGFSYLRGENPTRFALEDRLADLENGNKGLAFSSGAAAAGAVLELLDTGARVLVSDDLHARVYRLFEGVRKRTAGLAFDPVDMSDTAAVEAAIAPEKTKMLWVETPTDPLLKLADLAALAEIAKRHDIISVCDNSFCTPYVQRPLDHGIDIVVHASMQWLSGHADVAGGAAVVAEGRDFVRDRLAFLQNASGGAMSPFDAYLVLRSLKTLHVRMERHCATAERIAGWLANHPAIERVIYPGHESHPRHDLAARQMHRGRGMAGGGMAGGGMVSAVLKGGLEATRRFLERCRLFSLAESFGGAESLIEHPALMTHSAIPPEIREALGISDGLVRFSVGLEDAEDLIADLAQALG